MFPIRAKAILPVEQIIIQSVAVRGSLGDISVWISNDTTTHPTDSGNEVSIFKMSQKHWTKIYQHKHRASPRTYQTMDLTKFHDQPITLRPGQVRMMYIHSTLEGDTGTFRNHFHFIFTSLCDPGISFRGIPFFGHHTSITMQYSDCVRQFPNEYVWWTDYSSPINVGTV